MTDNSSLMKFPCDFPIKIIGKNTPDFTNDIIRIVRQHFPNTEDKSIVIKPSQQTNYVGLTATVRAFEQATLDALYQELTHHPDIKMVL